jgi:hypothetical protein
VTFDVLSCAASGAPGTQWADVLRSRGDQLTVEMRLELSHLAACHGGFSAAELAELRTLQASHPLWSKLPTFSDPTAPGPT